MRRSKKWKYCHPRPTLVLACPLTFAVLPSRFGCPGLRCVVDSELAGTWRALGTEGEVDRHRKKGDLQHAVLNQQKASSSYT